MNTFMEERMSWSARVFKSACLPVLKQILDCNFMNIEGMPEDEHRQLLDMHAGIDAWAYSDDGVRGLASRIQRCQPFYTFTVRKDRGTGYKTEYDKRKDAIHKQFLYPWYTMHAYVDADDKLERLAVCQTQALFDKIRHGEYYEVPMPDDDNRMTRFYVVEWRRFADTEIRIVDLKSN